MARPTRYSVQRKMAVVACLLRGEPLDVVAREVNVSVAKLTECGGQLHRRLEPFRHLHDCSGCFRLERLPGRICTHWKAPPSHGARRVEMWRGDVRLSMSVSAPFVWRCLSGSTVAPFPHPLIEPDRQICRVAQPLLAFAPTDPTMRRYRSGLFRRDPRRVDHCSHAWWIAGSGRGKAVRSWR